MATRNAKQRETWNKITGEMRIFGNWLGKGRDAKLLWSASVGNLSTLTEDWRNVYIPLKFCAKCTQPETDGLHRIDIKNAFFSVESYERKEDKKIVDKLVLVITDCEIVN